MDADEREAARILFGTYLKMLAVSVPDRGMAAARVFSSLCHVITALDEDNELLTKEA